MASYVTSSGGDQLTSGDGSLLTSHSFVDFTGTPTLPMPTSDGAFGEALPNDFTGASTIPMLVSVNGVLRVVRLFVGVSTLPALAGSLALVTSPGLNPLITSPSAGNLLFLRRVSEGHFITKHRFLGTWVLPMLTSDGSVAVLTNDFIGASALPMLTSAGDIFVVVNDFNGLSILLIPVSSNGHLEKTNQFIGVSTLPRLRSSGRRTGRVSPNIVFENWDTAAFDNTHLDAILNQYFGAATGGYDATSSLTGQPLDGNEEYRSITLRHPDLENREALEINPLIQRAYSGKVRSYIDTPAYFKMTLTWRLLRCDGAMVTSLLGLLYFDRIRYVLNDTTYELVLLDDVYEALYEARSQDRLTLNFRGRVLE